MNKQLIKSQWDSCEELMDRYSKTQEGNQHTENIVSLHIQLKKALTTEQWELFMKVESAMCEAESHHVYWMYCAGVTDGMQLQQEVNTIIQGGRP